MASIREVEAYERGLVDGIKCVRTVLDKHKDEQPTVDRLIKWLDRYIESAVKEYGLEDGVSDE